MKTNCPVCGAEIDLDPAAVARKSRWTAIPPDARREHARRMARARWAKRKALTRAAASQE